MPSSTGTQVLMQYISNQYESGMKMYRGGIGVQLSDVLHSTNASLRRILELDEHFQYLEFSWHEDANKKGWDNERAVVIVSIKIAEKTIQIPLPISYLEDWGLAKKVRNKMEKTMVRIIDGQLELHDGALVAMVNVSDEMVGVQKLSDGFALVTLEAYKRLTLEMLGIVEQMEKEAEYEVVPSSGYWRGEDYSGLYIQLTAKTAIGDLRISHCFWHDESISNDHLRLRVADRKLSLSVAEAAEMWRKAIEKSRKHVEGASNFTWDNTPEAYGPNRKAAAGEDGPGYQSSGLFPYSF